jgi:hypothetical protein
MNPTAAPVTLTIDPSKAGARIGDRFLGLSYETEQLLPDAAGRRYFRPDNAALINLFKTIGVKSLRVGGNSVDRPVTAIPTAADVDSLFAFARAADAKVIYSVRLQDGDARSAATIAKHIYDHHGEQLDCFAIGNEPAYYKPYENYRPRWRAIMEAIVAAVPSATFCGPDTNPDPAWCKAMVDEFAQPRGPLSPLTVHNYPGDCSYKNPGAKTVEELIPKDAAAAREQMLSSAWYEVYAKVHKGMADAVAGTAVPYRLAETNNFWYGGLHGASNSFAAALWSAEYLYWWASHGAVGLNFHTGDRVGGGSTSLTSRYTAFVTTRDGYEICPLSYGMKLFDLAGRGQLASITRGDDARPHLIAYATLTAPRRLTVTIINKSHGADARDESIDVKLQSPWRATSAQAISLTAPNADIAAHSGITLGGEAIRSDGTWNGTWEPVKSPSERGSLSVKVPVASAQMLAIELQQA